MAGLERQEPQRRARRMRLGGRAALAVSGVAAGALGFEFCLRLFAPQLLVTDRLRYTADAAAGFRLEPLQSPWGVDRGSINELGLRGPSIGSKREGETRIAVLGDSFVFGAGVLPEEALAAALEHELETRAGHGGGAPRCINAGTPNYGTAREAAWLESYGPALELDEVLLAVFVGNDFLDNLEDRAPRIHDGRLVSPDHEAEAELALDLRALARGSHTLRWLERVFLAGDRARLRSDGEARGVESRAGMQPDGREQFLRQEQERLAIYMPEEEMRPAVRQSFAHLGTCLERIRGWCQARGIAFKLVSLPDVVQVEPELLAEVAGRAGIDAARLDLELPQRFLGNWCAERGVPCCDLLPVFRRRAGAGESLYLEGDSHFSEAGHALAAQTCAATLWPD